MTDKLEAAELLRPLGEEIRNRADWIRQLIAEDERRLAGRRALAAALEGVAMKASDADIAPEMMRHLLWVARPASPLTGRRESDVDEAARLRREFDLPALPESATDAKAAA